MKNALPTIVLFILFLSCFHPAVGQRAAAGQRTAASQHSLPAASQKSLNNQLVDATYKGQLDKIVSLLKQGANIEARTEIFSSTPLIVATQEGNAGTVRLLLEKGANIEAKGHDGETPLMAVSTAEVAQLLLDKGADIDARDEISQTALMHAAQSDYTEVEKVLLDKGANIEAKDIFGWRTLQWAALVGRINSVKLLLDKGADIEAKDKEGMTVLHLACAEGKGLKENIEVVKLLLDSGANTEDVDQLGQTPLTLVAQGDRISTMKLLLDKGANIEAKDPNGYTALLMAVEQGKTNAVKLLLERGANIAVKSNQGETALDVANRLKSIAMADLIEQAARKRKQLEEAQAKDPKNIFAASLKAFQQSPKDESLREKVIRASFNLPEPQPIPEEARQLFTLTTDQIKQAGTPAALDQPIALLRKALEIAPWWSNAYYNLSRVLEMRGQYDDAARQLNYYLELKPAEADASEARAHLVVIQAEKDAVGQAQARQNAENEKLIKAAAEQPLQAPVDNGQLKNQQSAATNPPTRSRAGNPLPDPKLVWTDPATGLEWTKRDNAIEVDWEQAKAYCANLRLGGAGWRLPTFGELQGIYDPGVDVPGYQGYPKLGYAVVWHVKGDLKISGPLWSSTVGNDSGDPMTFYFVNGFWSPRQINIGLGMRVLCVRSSGE